MWVEISLTILTIWLFYKYYISIYNTHWQKRGIPCFPSKFPFGCDSRFMSVKQFRGHVIDKMYYHMAPNQLFGMFTMRSPMLIIRDLETIGLILTKEFSHFRDRNMFRLDENDITAHNLFNLEGERWRALRVKLTPTFTSGKLKSMFPFFIKSAEAFDTLLMSKVDSEVDVKELIGRLTTDIICSCAFGLDINTINDPDHELRKIGVETLKLKLLTLIRFGLIRAIPKLEKILGTRFTPIETEKYLLNLVKSTVEYRGKNGIIRNDFLDLLIQLKNNGNVGEELKDEIEEQTCKPFEMTIPIMTAQCFVFFVAGFETSSSVQSFCLYELAINQEIQARVRTEIENTLRKHGGLTYQAIQEMVYLDMVMSETMRKYPTLITLMRRCTKSLTTPKGYRIESGDLVVIPIWSLHHDPEHFPNPEKFDPERFSADNRCSIKSFSYLPFGEGPRMCIGMRFGLLQTKVGIITILRKFKIEPCAKTNIPLELAGAMITNTKDPIMLKLRALPDSSRH